MDGICRIITLNTWKADGDYPARLSLMADALARLAPDVVCLQECFASAEPALDTAAALAHALNMQAIAAPARQKSRRIGGQAALSTSGLAVLSRLNLVSADSMTLPSDPADGERIAQFVRLGWRDGELLIINLHLTHLRGASTLRSRQIEQVLLARSRLPAAWTVLAGDFNATPEAPEMTPLTRCGADWGPGQPCRADPTVRLGHGTRPTRAVDHVLLLRQPGAPVRVRRRLRVIDSADADGRYASDHAGVMIELERASTCQRPMPA